MPFFCPVVARLLLKHRSDDCKFVRYWKKERYVTLSSFPFGALVVVEIGANRQSCDTSRKLLFKLVLKVVLGTLSGSS